METLHQVIEGRTLSKVITLPKSLQDALLEITVTPIIQKEPLQLTRSKLKSFLQGSHTEALSGALQVQSDMLLEESRAERRIRYECFD